MKKFLKQLLLLLLALILMLLPTMLSILSGNEHWLLIYGVYILILGGLLILIME